MGPILSSSGVYSITTPSGKQYVGSAHTFYRRWSRHRSDLAKGIHHSRGLQASYAKYGLDGLTFNILLVCSKSDVIFYEQFFIDHLKPRLNGSKTAGNVTGLKHTAEARKNMSEAQKRLPNNSGRFQPGQPSNNKGQPATVEARLKMSEAAKRRGFDPNKIEKMRLANIGRPVHPKSLEGLKRYSSNGPTPEHREKMAEAKRRAWADPAYRDRMLKIRAEAAATRALNRG